MVGGRGEREGKRKKKVKKKEQKEQTIFTPWPFNFKHLSGKQKIQDQCNSEPEAVKTCIFTAWSATVMILVKHFLATHLKCPDYL